MDHREVGRYWDENADAWTQLARAGYDVCRDRLNTPEFFELLPDVRGLVGLDIGCGEGHNTRLLAQRGARVTAYDISGRFVGHAKASEDDAALGIGYAVASAVEMPFADGTFDFATAFMSFMDIPETDRVLSEAYRILRPGGFLQFPILHPCFSTPHRKVLRDDRRRAYAIEVGGYFEEIYGEVEEWSFASALAGARHGLPKFRVPRFDRTVSGWLNLVVDAGFVFERLAEPTPSDEVVRECPYIQDEQVAPNFMHVRVRKRGPAANPR